RVVDVQGRRPRPQRGDGALRARARIAPVQPRPLRRRRTRGAQRPPRPLGRRLRAAVAMAARARAVRHTVISGFARLRSRPGMTAENYFTAGATTATWLL